MKDLSGDRIEIEKHADTGTLLLVVNDSSLRAHMDRGEEEHQAWAAAELSPKKARKLARKLIAAADEVDGGEITAGLLGSLSTPRRGTFEIKVDGVRYTAPKEQPVTASTTWAPAAVDPKQIRKAVTDVLSRPPHRRPEPPAQLPRYLSPDTRPGVLWLREGDTDVYRLVRDDNVTTEYRAGDKIRHGEFGPNMSEPDVPCWPPYAIRWDWDDHVITLERGHYRLANNNAVHAGTDWVWSNADVIAWTREEFYALP